MTLSMRWEWLRALALLAAVVAWSAGASSRAGAQETVYTLDESGEWTVESEPAPGTDEAIVAEARRLLAEERPGAAFKVIDPWIDRFERSGHYLLPEALLIRGDARSLRGDEYKALYDYEELFIRFPGSTQFLVAIERELDIGIKYLSGMRRKFWGLRIADADDVGEELLVRVQERAPGTRLAERAGIELADYYFRIRDMETAAEAYELFLLNFPESAYRQQAMKRQIYATISRYRGPNYDGTPLLDAQLLVRQFGARYPAEAEESGLDEALLARLEESAAAELLETGRWYLDRGDTPSARFTLRRLVRQHPQTAAASEAMRILIDRGWMNPGAAPAATETADPAASGDDAPVPAADDDRPLEGESP